MDDLTLIRVAPDPQLPSGLGECSLSHGACRLLGTTSPLMIQRCLGAVSTSLAIQWVRGGTRRFEGGRHWQIPLSKPRRWGARQSGRRRSRARDRHADRVRERDSVAAVGSRSKTVSDTASRPVCRDSAEVFAEGIILLYTLRMKIRRSWRQTRTRCAEPMGGVRRRCASYNISTHTIFEKMAAICVGSVSSLADVVQDGGIVT